MQLSIFDFLNEPKVFERMKEILMDHKEFYRSEIGLEILDYSISTAVSNRYMPEGAALMSVYVLLPNHTATILMVNKKTREQHSKWVHEMKRHSVYNELAHEMRKNPDYRFYSLDDHFRQHFQTVEIEGLKISSNGNPYQVRDFIDRHEW